MRYTVVMIPSVDGGYVAYVPAIPGCVTEGETIDEALAMAADAAGALLADMAEAGEDLPTERPGAAVGSVEVPVPVAPEVSPAEAVPA